MAKDTKVDLRNMVMYSAFIRNHTEEGTFLAFAEDLDRIKGLGVDIIWLMPIHPVGEEKRKGKDGSPYAISDYRKTNPDYGTMEDFIFLVDEIHKREMKCIIDVVYNHTSPDSLLVKSHTEYFYRKEDGRLGNRIGEWTDVVDLDYSNSELWQYQIDTLKMWAKIVDGFRCDVAPMVPLDFWKRAREEVKKVKEGCIWLAESSHYNFVKYMRDRHMECSTDNDLYQAFDLCYDYDVYPGFVKYLKGKYSLSQYIESLMMQEGIYPENYVKLRFLENHDNERLASYVKEEADRINWIAFSYFEKGTTLIYEGEEVQAEHRPSIFDKDVIIWEEEKDLSDLMRSLYRVKQNAARSQGVYSLRAYEEKDIIVGRYKEEKDGLLGIFRVKGNCPEVSIEAEDGIYKNLFDDSEVQVKNGIIKTEKCPIIFQAKLRKENDTEPFEIA